MALRRPTLALAAAAAAISATPAHAGPEAAHAAARLVALATYERPFGPAAGWNQPLAGRVEDPNSWLVADLWDAGRPTARVGANNLNIVNREYSYPVYLAADGSASCPVKVRHADWGSNLVGGRVPCSPSWKPSHGVNWPVGSDYDSQMIVLDPATGREWDLWQYAYASGVVTIGNGNLVPGDYRTRVDGFPGSRGAGIPYLALLVMPEEVAHGLVDHAMTLGVPSLRRDASASLDPATRTDGDQFGTFPPPRGLEEGRRFGLRVTDADIAAWSMALPACVTAVGRASARVLARAARDYGWMVVDNAGSTETELADVANPATKTAWANLGLGRQTCSNGKEYPRDLYDGLVTVARLWAVAP